MKFIKNLDASNNTYYVSEDKELIILKIEKKWSIWKQLEEVEVKSNILDGYKLEWEGLYSLKESKEFVKTYLE